MESSDLSHQVPAMDPPAGVTSNFVNPPSRAIYQDIAAYITFPIMVLFLLLRLYARIRVSGVAVDDYLCVLSAAAMTAYVAMSFRIVEQGAGPHMWDIPASKLTASYIQTGALLILLYYVAAMFVKTSILVLYWRIFQSSRKANILLWAGIVCNISFYLAFIATYIGTCIPRPEDGPTGGWLSPQFQARSHNIEGIISAVTGVAGSIINIYILCVPLIFLWGVHISVKRKASISAVFIAGSGVCLFSVGCAIFRTWVATSSSEGRDMSWNAVIIGAICMSEINLGIACSCLPVVFVLFKGFSSRSSSWISKIGSFVPSYRKLTNSPSAASGIRAPMYQKMDEETLPPIQGGTLTGLKYSMRNFNRTRPTIRTMSVATELMTVRSVDYNNHAQLT